MTTPLPETLMRTLDLSYPSNRYAALGTVGAVLLGRLSGRSWSAAGRGGVLAFFAWAAARELDPDHAETAAVALPVAAVLAWLDGERSATQAALDVAGAGALLAGLRYTTGSVGAAADQVDDLALLGAAAVAALSGQHAAALVPALAPAAARRSRGEEVGNELLRGVLALLPAAMPASRSSGVGRLAALGSLLLAQRLTAPEMVDAQTDRGTGPVPAERVQLARLLSAGASALSAAEGRGGAGGVLAAVNLAVGLRRSRA